MTVLEMFTWIARRWACFRHTLGAHELDLHTGVCRFCRQPWVSTIPVTLPR